MILALIAVKVKERKQFRKIWVILAASQRLESVKWIGSSFTQIRPDLSYNLEILAQKTHSM